MYTTNTKWAKESKNETTTKKKGYKGGKELKKKKMVFSVETPEQTGNAQ
jgi:hypothetical protein